MASSTIDGLSSGLDTTSIVNQLIALERAPADRLTTRKTAADTKASAFGTLKSKVDAVKTALEAMDAATDWSPAKATSSKDAVATAAASAGAKPGSLSFTVAEVATSHTIVSTGAAKASDASWADGDVVLNVGGVDETVTVAPDGNGVRSLGQVASAINGAGLGLRAQAVQVAPGQYRLQLSATETGAAKRFSVVSGFADGYGTAIEGRDAELELAGGLYRATSPTNTFEDLLPGVDVTVAARSAEPVTVTVATDAEAVAAKVQALVTAVNGAITSAKSLTAYNATTKRGSPLTGEPNVARLTQALTRGIVDPVEGNDVLPASVGITLGRDGSLTFDKDKFLKAFAAGPDAVQDLFVKPADGTTNLGSRLLASAKEAVATGTGYLLTAQETQRNRVSAFTTQIEAIERRLEISANRWRKQFSSMETALSNMKSQSNWLAGQLSSLSQ